MMVYDRAHLLIFGNRGRS